MAEKGGKGQDSKKPKLRKSLLDMVGEDFCFGELPSRDPPPGFYRFISPEQIKLVIEMVTRTSLFPVTIEERKDLSLAPPKKMEFNEIGEYISAKLDLSVPIPLKFFLEKDSRLDSSRIIEMIFLIVDCIRTSQIKEEHADEKQKEFIDRALWSAMFSSLLGNSSVVYEEVEIGEPTLPHGYIDVVAGLIDTDDFKCCAGVHLQGSDYEVTDDPIGTSANTRNTLYTSSQTVAEHFALSEVLQTKTPFVFFGGTRETFRPFIRILESDLLYTTQTVYEFHTAQKTPDVLSLTLLSVLILGLFQSYDLSSHPVTGWSDIYRRLPSTYSPSLKPRLKGNTPEDSRKRQTKYVHFTEESLQEVEKLYKLL